MPFATARTITLQGAIGHLVDVQADVSHGTVGVTVVGRPDTGINEGRDRCRMAISNSELDWPATRRVTLLLSPADVPKSGPHFDLAMAVAVLGATGVLEPASLEHSVFIGELTLDGRLRPMQGVLPMTMAAADRGITVAFVPEPQAGEARLVPGVTVFGVRSLTQVVATLQGRELPDAPPVEGLSASPLLTWRGQDRMEAVDLADIDEMADARYAIEVAAAGAHHIMLSGPKGAGKTTLAERIPGILPDLTLDESLELTAIHSLAGCLQPGDGRIIRPPYGAPHSSSTRASLLGGGSGRVRPGEISRAHCGVLLMDEFPLFNADIIEALRQPLESGDITIGRGDEVATFPARGMFVFAANPCPCGNYHPHAGQNQCTCSPQRLRDYRRKLEGPVLDRVDITRHVQPVRHTSRGALDEPPESTAVVRARVEGARARQLERFAGEEWRTNSQIPGPALSGSWHLTRAATKRLDAALLSGKITRRGATRVQRVAWTVADLAGRDRPGIDELDTALRLRTGAPLVLSVVRRRRVG